MSLVFLIAGPASPAGVADARRWLPAADKPGERPRRRVVFLASGLVDQTLTDASGRVLLTRKRLPGDLVILPIQRAGDRFITSIDGLSNAVLLTLDRDSLVQGLGADVEKVATSLDQLSAQEVAAMEAAAVQTESRAGAPIVAFGEGARHDHPCRQHGGGSANVSATGARTCPLHSAMRRCSGPNRHRPMRAHRGAARDFEKVPEPSSTTVRAWACWGIAAKRSTS